MEQNLDPEHGNIGIIQHWKKEQEEILKKWGDKALCFKIMHDKSYKKYWCLNAWFNIPIIIISTLSGAINFSSNNWADYKNSIILFSGSMNIFTGIMGTVASYIGLSKKVEGHRIAYLSWDKFSRKIQIELSKPRDERVNVKDFIKLSSDEYDRLIEISPILGDDIIRWMREFIHYGELEESNINKLCLCWYDSCLFPCNCTGMLYCCSRRSKNNINQDNINIFSTIEKPEILGYVNTIQIIKEEPKLNTDNEYSQYSFSRVNAES